MKRSIIWTTAGIAAIGFAVPAFATSGNSTNPTVPASVTVTANTVKNSGTDSVRDIIEASTVAPAAVTPTSVDDNATRNSVDDDATTNSVEDVSGNCDEAEHANDAACAGTAQAGDDNEADDDDATSNSVEDVSGNCDEAEHANDADCTGAAAPSNTVDDNSGHDGDDDSGHGSDDSGHGGNDG
jgi:hypothetical protein